MIETADSSRVICWGFSGGGGANIVFEKALLADFVVLMIFGIESGLFAG